MAAALDRVVAMDGPSGSGKSTVARRVAQQFGLRYLDTGAMYRALTWWLLEVGIDLDDADRVAAEADAVRFDVGENPAAPTIGVNGRDCTAAIRETRVAEQVSRVATNLAVRRIMVSQQRRICEEGRVVAEGRDITTVVAPDAPLRVLVTASQEARLARRAKELHGTADAAAVAATRTQIVARDAKDSTVVNFTDAAEGVSVVDTSNLTLEESVAAVFALARAAGFKDA